MSGYKGYRVGSIDLVIPVYKPDEKFDRLLEMISGQSVKPAHIYFMQTLTGDDKYDISLQKKMFAISKTSDIIPVVTTLSVSTYDHGGTRNKGASMSDAEYVLFMTQDAVPGDERLIENLLYDAKKEGVAVSYARQMADDSVGYIEKYTREFNYPPTGCTKSLDDLKSMGIKTFFCSNVCAMYRHSVYDKLGGFKRRTIFNEDMIYAAHAIQTGYSISYVAKATVIHAHKYTYRQQFSRNFDMAVSQRQNRDVFDSVRSEGEGIRLVKDTANYLMHSGKWYLIFDLIAQSGAKYLGYLMGQNYEKLPKGVVKKLSMNKKYWDRR